MHSKLWLCGLIFTALEGICSRIYINKPPLFAVRSSRYGFAKPGIVNCDIGKLSSNLLSDTSKMSSFPTTISLSKSSLFHMMLVFKWVNMTLFTFSTLKLFRKTLSGTLGAGTGSAFS